ncbi:hypothetical protein K435DRAFT_772710 [Dendrothele bispora CBS 962.96]|uniref:Uncharacterized protein n=1 Tax=Dendrothele bispora (strain CBS 962.96) TaxID=1314807 RepID=A0A4S8MW87_DENBC|nr:hypothetical protein K435DRAFT_772710 [Dendrothele bispora CBS 962.96]
MDSTNAVAGPSKPRNSPPPLAISASNLHNSNLEGERERVPLFLRPAAKPSQTAYIKSTNDLLGQFCLYDAYDQYVTPFYSTTGEGGSGTGGAAGMGEMGDGPASPTTPGPGGVDKGKGREIPVPGSTPATHAQTPAADGQDGDDDEGGGKGEKKKKNTYKHLIKGVPGKHSMKKDDYFVSLLAMEPKPRNDIRIFTSVVLKNAFQVSLEGIKGWNTSALVLDSAQAREDRRKRKELRRLAKAQLHAQQAFAAASAVTPNTNSHSIQAPIPTSATPGSFPPSASTPTSTSIPRTGWPGTSGTPRPTGGPGTPRPPNTGSGTTVNSTSTATSMTSTATATPAVQRPGSTRPAPVQIPPSGARAGTPRTGTPTAPHPLSAPPLSANSLGGSGIPPPTTAAGPGSGVGNAVARGQKRPREDMNAGAVGTNGIPVGPQTNGLANAPSPPKAIIGAKAGNNGVRPRPLKKPRVDSEAPAQQPTPHE